MKTNIDYIVQVDGSNVLHVVYKSGAERHIEVNGMCAPTYHLTKTQQDFMDNSFKVVCPELNGWGCTLYYWFVDKSHYLLKRFAEVGRC